MKRSLLLLVALLPILGGNPVWADGGAENRSGVQVSNGPEAASPATTADDSRIVVYRTETGKKYHRAGCRHLSKHKVSLKEAKEQGLTPCKVCKPPVAADG